MADIRIAYQFHHLSEDAKDTARSNESNPAILEQRLYNKDGTIYLCG